MGTTEQQTAAEVLVMRDIDKSFPGVQALRKVSLSISAGEVHAVEINIGAVT